MSQLLFVLAGLLGLLVVLPLLLLGLLANVLFGGVVESLRA